jgi:HPt (histidine-containing phosphotransfer) domain-containing protein
MKTRQHSQRESDLPIELAQPARRALAAAGIQRLEQLARLSEDEVKQLHGIGPNALNQLRRALRARGLSFAHGRKEN